MSEEIKAFVKGLTLGLGVVGAGGILVGPNWITGALLLSIAIIANITLKKIWSKYE